MTGTGGGPPGMPTAASYLRRPVDTEFRAVGHAHFADIDLPPAL